MTIKYAAHGDRYRPHLPASTWGVKNPGPEDVKKLKRGTALMRVEAIPFIGTD
jgi:hypothetical protein